MVSGSLGLLLIAGVIMGHLVGVRMFQYTRSKLGGTDDARGAITKLIEEIRTAKMAKLGTGSQSTFVECGVNAEQKGNAIQLYATTSTNAWIRYFLSSDNCLHRMTNGSSSAPVMASYVTNSVVFTAEDYQGTILTNNQNNRVIGLTLQFYQIQYPVMKIGSNQFFDFYQVRTKVTRRVLE